MLRPTSISQKMCWFRSLLFLATGCFLALALVHDRISEENCITARRLRETWKEIEKLNGGETSQECTFTNKSSLCEPEQIVKRVVSDKEAIVLQILNETAKLFERDDVPFSNVRAILEFIYYILDQLKPCLKSKTSLPLTDSSIEDCFTKLQLFLNEGTSNCTWQVVQKDVMVVFQQLEFDLSASRHRLPRGQLKNILVPV